MKQKWATTIQTDRDERIQPFEGMKQEHSKFYSGDMASLDDLEAKTLGAIASMREKTIPRFQPEEVQKLGDKALAETAHYEVARISRLEAEANRLRGLVPQRPQLSEIEQHRQTSLTLYRLQQLEGRPLDTGDGRPIRADLNDPLHFRLLFETVLSAGETKAVDALLSDPLDRHARFLSNDQRARGEAVLGFAAKPELAQQINSYQLMIQRYRSRIATMRTRLKAQGWTDGDPVKERAGKSPDAA